MSIPNNVTTIGEYAFSDCQELADVYCNCTTLPTTATDAFYGSYIEYATLHVPESAIDDYKATSPWSGFGTFASLTDDDIFYNLTVTSTDGHGTVTYGETEITGDSRTFNIKSNSAIVLTLSPDEGYQIGTVTINGEDATAQVENNTLTINDINVNSDININVMFCLSGTTLSYYWQGGETLVEFGGRAVASDGESVNYLNVGNGTEYYTIRINKRKPDVENDNVEITLDEPLQAGDQIAITGYRNKDSDANGNLYILFENGAEIDEGEEVTWNNVYPDFGQQPNTNKYIVTDGAGSRSFKIARSKTGTNVFITKIEIYSDGIPSHTMTINVNNAHGNVSYGQNSVSNGEQTFYVKEGTNATLNISPNLGYIIEYVLVDGEDKTASVSDGSLTIENITANTTISVTFVRAGDNLSVTLIASMGTLCSTEDLDFTDVSGLEAYIGSGFNRSTGSLLLTRVYDVPAGTGLVLKGTAGSTYEIPYSTSSSVYANLLRGVTSATTISTTDDGYTNYILANGTNGTGFYIVSGTGELAAGKAYLSIPSASAASRQLVGIEFTDGTTGISGIEDDNRSDFYSISGQRIKGTPAKTGIYIKDGRKVIIK